jgi:uncharacterized RDD family membrane protein YckC
VSSVETGQGYERVVTPEAVPIELDLAGIGSRGIAMLIDVAIQSACLVAVLLAIAGLHLGEAATVAITSIATFMLFFGYFFILEGLWHGRTPGKAAQRLRAVRVDGQPMSTAQMFVRNIVRIVDFLPAYYLIGCISIAITKRSQRLGDLAAGTLVIREPKPFTPRPVHIAPPPPVAVDGPSPRLDVSAMKEAHYQLARSFFERRDALEVTARAHLAAQVASAIRPVVRATVAMSDERLIEAAATAYRQRFAPGT